MNMEWSGKNKKMQSLIGKESSFDEGIALLFELREDLFDQITSIVNAYPKEAFYQMPFVGAKGYHGKTLSYSLWHIFRIEDIVAHTLISGDSQVLFTENWLQRINSPIITTGNELKGEEIAEFSMKLNVRALYDYCKAVMESTNELLKKLQYKDLKRKFMEDDRERIIETDSVSKDEKAIWLIDYWCGKDVKGLIQMPYSRHWIMHIEAMCRIKNELCRKARKGVDPIAFCGLSCDHCFLKEWCGGCRTSYNTCSYATCNSDRICQNATCCKEKDLDGCYDCDHLAGCMTGFFSNGNDTNAVKAMAMFIHRHGKQELAAVLDNLHKKYDFQKIQEILGDNLDEGIKTLEEYR